MGGEWRGKLLAGLGKGDPSAQLRPTSDRVRESLFNLLAHGPYGNPVPGARVLDLFAGTGALGLEALSRGAATAIFIDSGKAAQALIAENIARTGAGGRARLLRADATRLRAPADEPATLVFLDPPYGKGLGPRALKAARERDWIAPGAMVVWEDDARQPPPPGFIELDHRQYGRTHIHILEEAA